MYWCQEEMWERRDDFTSGILLRLVGLLIFWKNPFLLMHRYDVKATCSFCKTPCCSWKNPSGLATGAKYRPSIHEETLQNHGEPLILCTGFLNAGCRFPICSACPYNWLQTGLLCPWIEWILHTVLDCVFNWIQPHEWHQSSLKPSRAPFWPSVVKFGV